MPEWSERQIATYLCRNVFERALVLVDRCAWTGAEADLLVVHRSMRLIDVEVKISRADFKADASKRKWWYGISRADRASGRKRAHLWPRRVWKHYFALPEDIWKDSLYESCSTSSGILLLTQHRGAIAHRVLRKATPNPRATPVTAAQALDIARLASLRMWDAYAARDSMEHAAAQHDGARGTR